MIIENKNIQDCIVKIVEKYPFVKDIFQTIDQAGGKILLVGGSVRDFFLEMESNDLDFEVYHLAFEVLQKILERYGQVHLVGKSFGVLRLNILNADFSLPRKDSSGRKPDVFIDQNMTFSLAFRRRDLTINAMGIDVNTGQLIDPFNGLIDLKNKILRAPDLELFGEDPLRLFRVMQFAGRLEFAVDEKLSEVCSIMNTSQVSRERIEDEFKKLFLQSKKPSIGLSWLEKIKKTKELFPEIMWSEKIYLVIDQVAQLKNSDLESRLIFSWAALFSNMQIVKDLAIFLEKPVDQKIIKKIITILEQSILQAMHKKKIAYLLLYAQYLPELINQKKVQPYKWIAWWIRKTISIRELMLFCYCLFDKKIIEQTYDVFKNLQLLDQAEEPLLHGGDLILYSSEKNQLKSLIELAYQLQIDEQIQTKKKLLERLKLK